MAVTGAVVLTAAGCGGGDASPSSDTNAPNAKMASPTAAPSKPPHLTRMRFSTDMYACKPKATSQVPGSWETKAPRFRVKPGSKVTLGLTNSGGAKTPVLAVVITQHGGRAFAKATPKGSWSTAVFPKNFITAKSHKRVKTYPTGIYTVVWVTAQGHKFISCDGFATVGAKEPKTHKPHAPRHSTKPSPSHSAG